MRCVARLGKPQVLQRNSQNWRNQLLAEIERCKTAGEAVADRFTDKYRKDEVRSSLRSMYQDRCCYCEIPIRVVTYDQIEHRKPKDISLFPEETFEWTNLHLACPNCNRAKSNKWDYAAPILDASDPDDVITDHLEYRSTVGLRRWPLTDRGETTICHADLDRDPLPDTRLHIYGKAMQTILDINRTFKTSGGSVQLRALVRELRAKESDDYGSVFTWAINEWLVDELKN